LKEQPPRTDVSIETTRIEARQKIEERRNERLGHAIAFLKNHSPQFGEKPYRGDPDDSWKDSKGSDADTLMSHVPREVKDHLVAAMIEAARFAERTFKEPL
jgi:hypothetical protein